MRAQIGAIGLLSLCSCQLVFPYTARPEDAARPDSRSGDQLTSDGPASLERRADASCAMVEADPLGAPTCPVPACGGLSDCDGIPDSRDPQPGACNALVWADPFFQESWGTVWGRSYCSDGPQVACGVVRFLLPAVYTQIIWTAQQITPGEIIEARVLTPRTSMVMLQAVDYTLPFDDCHAFPQYNDQVRRGCSLKRLADGTAWLTASVSPGDPVPDPSAGPLADGWVTLQSFVSGSEHICRAINASGQTLTATIGVNGSLPPTTLLVVQAVNESLTQGTQVDLDWVRIFQGQPGS